MADRSGALGVVLSMAWTPELAARGYRIIDPQPVMYKHYPINTRLQKAYTAECEMQVVTP